MKLLCLFHRREATRRCIDCGLALCLQCCSFYGRCMGCHHQASVRQKGAAS